MKLPAGLRSLSLRTLVALLATLAMAMAVFSLYLVPPAPPPAKAQDSVLALNTMTVDWQDVVIPVYSQGQATARHDLPLVWKSPGEPSRWRRRLPMVGEWLLAMCCSSWTRSPLRWR